MCSKNKLAEFVINFPGEKRKCIGEDGINLGSVFRYVLFEQIAYHPSGLVIECSPGVQEVVGSIPAAS